MKKEGKSDHIILEPSWKHFFWGYTLSVITAPLLVGLIALYFVRQKHKSIKYQITDTQITAIDQKYQHKVDLVDIEDVQINKSWLQQKLDIGTLQLQTSASTMDLVGLTKPEKTRDILEQAIQSQQKLQQQREETQKKEPDFKPGSIDRLEYLTGLWQQGLISDADYESERKNFE